MQYWLVKSEPEAYSWADLVKDGKTSWTGVRNFQARNNLAQMKKDDLVLFYHSVSEKSVVGIARVANEAYPDNTTDDTRWQAVDLAPNHAFKKAVTLEQIKKENRLENIALLKQSRLSVMPLKPEEFEIILGLGN
ncbi:MAG: ubiquinol-cytochrome reductase [Adhaeribacter sp.]|nr:ubiquinol-cytochrome reductase [Adhaeribacter sp.]